MGSPKNNVNATSGLCYFMCAEIPGIATAGSDVVTGHQVYRYRLSGSKDIKIGYNGNLNASAQVRIQTLDIVMDMSKTALFVNAGFNGTVFKKITLLNLKNYGATNMAKPGFKIELVNAKLVEVVSSASYAVGVAAEAEGPDFFKSNFKNSNDIKNIGAVGLSFTAQEYNIFYFPVNAAGAPQGQVATSFNVPTNTLGG